MKKKIIARCMREGEKKEAYVSSLCIYDYVYVCVCVCGCVY